MKSTLCMKVAVIPKQGYVFENEFIKLKKDSINVEDELFILKEKTYKAMNKASMRYYMCRLEEAEFEKENGRKRTKEEIKMVYGYETIEGYTNRLLTDELPDYYAGGASQMNNLMIGNFKTADGGKKKANNIIRGIAHPPCYGENIQCIFRDTQYMIGFNETKKEYHIDVSLFSLAKLKNWGLKKGSRFRFVIVKPDASNKAILQRCMSKEYKQGAIKINKNKKGKWILDLSFSFEGHILSELNQDRTLGLDLGMVNIVVGSIYDAKEDDWLWQQIFINGEELNTHRQRYERRIRSMQRATKWSSDNKTGHGRKQRCRDYYKIADKYGKFKETYNHKISKYIIDVTLKNQCATIQVEDLSEIKNIEQKKFLRSWAYYDLQEKIKYKAEKLGIQFIKVNPQYTSKRCCDCGCIHEDNRDGKNNQSKFKCIACGNDMNADVNASKNIAIPHIDTIIKEYINKGYLNTGKKDR